MAERITILGTGSAFVTRCYNTCFIIDCGVSRLMVDAGGGNGILTQLEKAGVAIADVGHLFLTHAHTDHVIGAVWVARAVVNAVKKQAYDGALHIYGHKRVINVLTEICRLTFSKKDFGIFQERIVIDVLTDGCQRKIAGMDMTFFSIHSTKEEQYGFRAATPEGIAGTKKEAFDELSKLEDEKMYHAYVSLDKVYSFSEFKALAEKNDLEPTWCAISVKNKDQTESKYTTYNTGNIGFRMYTSCSSLAFDQKKYPLLTAFSLAEQESAKKNVLEEKDVTKHMTSMLQYLQDNDDIVKMIENDQGTGKTDYASMIDSIQKDGLYIYGYYVEDIGKELKKLKDIGNVSYVYTTEMK